MVPHMSTTLRTVPSLADLQNGDQITIQDGKGQQLTGKAQVRGEDRIFIAAFSHEFVIAKWKRSRLDPDDGWWDGKIKVVDWVAPIPGL
jgi:hypothetical protein